MTPTSAASDIKSPQGPLASQRGAAATSDSHGNFVFFDCGRPHQAVAAALAAHGIDIGRAYPPLDMWVRISIGLPEDNAVARQAVADLLP